MATESVTHGHGVGPSGPPVAVRGSRLSIGLTGMLIFIGSEVMLFGSLFTSYFLVRFDIARNHWPPLNSAGEPFELPKVITGMNTFILVSSSFTVWWAEHCLKHGDRKGLIRSLGITMMLGATFLIVQINEYVHLGFTPKDTAFGSTFYILTGFHGAHVTLGLTILFFCFVRARVGDFTPTRYAPLAAASVYWHFVDVVWVFLYLLVYIM